MAHKRHKRQRKRYQFQVIVEKDTIPHTIAQQTLRYKGIDPSSPTGDYLIYVGYVEEKTLYDDMIAANRRAINLEQKRMLQL